MQPPPETHWATTVCIGPHARGCDCAEQQQWADDLDKATEADRQWLTDNLNLARA